MTPTPAIFLPGGGAGRAFLHIGLVRLLWRHLAATPREGIVAGRSVVGYPVRPGAVMSLQPFGWEVLRVTVHTDRIVVRTTTELDVPLGDPPLWIVAPGLGEIAVGLIDLDGGG